jgi:AAA domain
VATNLNRKLRMSADEQQRRLDLFDGILITHPRLAEIEERTIALMRQTKARTDQNTARLIAANHRTIKFRELWVLPIIGPTGSTKSTSMEYIIDKIYQDPKTPKDDLPILIVTLKESTRSPKQLSAKILAAFKDPAAEEVLKQVASKENDFIISAIAKIARRKKTLVLVLDEASNLLIHDAGKIGTIMAKAIRSLVNEACFSVILMGTDDTKRFFKLDPELKMRLQGDRGVSMTPFSIEEAEDRGYFFGFVERLERAMVSAGVVDNRLGLTEDFKTRAQTFDMANGIIGAVHRNMRRAIQTAFRDGRTNLEFDDFANAFSDWNRAEKQPQADPFELGPQTTTLQYVRLDKRA